MGNLAFVLKALNSIKQRADSVEYNFIGALIFNEMAIRQNLEYNGINCSGYVDMGNIACDDTMLAKEAVVFMVVCVNSGWKIPIAYYLVNGITAEQKCNLVLQCISALHDVKMKIVSVTYDRTSINLTTLKYLGCNFSTVNALQTTFQHPISDKKIVAFADPCHMVKLVRTILASTENGIMDSKNRLIISILMALHNIQQNEGMHLGNKMRKVHINFHKQKIKVRLATQILSQSVANLLEFCRDVL